MTFYQSTGVNVDNTFSNVSRDQVNITHLVHSNDSELDLNTCLVPVNEASYNRGGPVARCLQSTRKELIATIVRWVCGGGSHPICWLNGPAGSGKSAVSQTVAEWCATNNRLAASFFFFRGAGNRSNIARFIPTLAYQLSLSVPATKPLLQRVLQSEPSIARQSLRHQFNKLMIEPILAVRKPILGILALRKPMAIVIDALDECNDKDLMAEFITIIIDAFQDNHRLPFRVFFTSRVEEHIRKKLEAPPARSAMYPLALQDFDARVDIRTFFKSRFATIYEENHRVLQNIPLPWPSDSDLEALVRKSDGSFIFAVTLISFIDDGSDLPHRKIQAALGVNAGLDPLYTQVLSAAPRGHHFERIIGTIMLLSSTLPINSLGPLLQLETADILQALLGIQSILMIPGDDNQPIRLFHTSLRDFLTTRQRSREFFIDPPTRHLFITTDCLKVITTQPKGGVFRSGVQRYACENWCFHLHQCLVEGGSNLLNSWSGDFLLSCLMHFMSQSLKPWVETLILIGELQTVLRVLHSALSDLKQLYNCPQNLLQVLEDITMYAELKCQY